MAATPLFQSSLAVLKSKLRLSNLPTTGDVNIIVDEAVMDARLDMYRRLGASRVAVLVALPSSATPTTEDQILRSLAEGTEVKLTRLNLLGTMPYSWQDAGGDVNQRWNQEAPFRDMGGEEIAAEKSRLASSIEDAYQILSAEDVIGDEKDFRVFDGTPVNAPPAPLDSVRRTASRRLKQD